VHTLDVKACALTDLDEPEPPFWVPFESDFPPPQAVKTAAATRHALSTFGVIRIAGPLSSVRAGRSA
jgi:hypothetical protein